ncbi:hypothetical protein H6F38_14350 [Paenibacillus sp. EKM208P]|nr:hypothetical protein H6F38_14350 [Paenibacillus sp. EKM208P]
MKKKTRKIYIGEKEYLYVINQKYHNGINEITLSISLKELKNTIISFHFCTYDDSIVGSPLLVGAPLKEIVTGNIENLNLHHPRVVRLFVLYGLENGWNELSRMEFDGLKALYELGYDSSWLKPKHMPD